MGAAKPPRELKRQTHAPEPAKRMPAGKLGLGPGKSKHQEESKRRWRESLLLISDSDSDSSAPPPPLLQLRKRWLDREKNRDGIWLPNKGPGSYELLECEKPVPQGAAELGPWNSTDSKELPAQYQNKAIPTQGWNFWIPASTV